MGRVSVRPVEFCDVRFFVEIFCVDILLGRAFVGPTRLGTFLLVPNRHLLLDGAASFNNVPDGCGCRASLSFASGWPKVCF